MQKHGNEKRKRRHGNIDAHYFVWIKGATEPTQKTVFEP
jgi:hypothetical protein